ERQAWLAVDIVHDGLRQLRVVGHLLGVQSQPDDLARGGTGRQVATPATHQIEEGAARRQYLGVQPLERGDRAVVDVDDLAREGIEAIVRRVVVPLEGRGRLGHLLDLQGLMHGRRGRLEHAVAGMERLLALARVAQRTYSFPRLTTSPVSM